MHGDSVELVVQVQLDKVLEGLDSSQQEEFLRHWLNGVNGNSRMEVLYDISKPDQRGEFVRCWIEGLDSAQIEKALDAAQQDGFLRHWLNGGLVKNDNSRMEVLYDISKPDQRGEFVRCWIEDTNSYEIAEEVLSSIAMEALHNAASVDQRGEFVRCWIEDTNSYEIAEEVLSSIAMENLHNAASISQRDDFVKHWIEGASQQEIASCMNKYLDADDLSDILKDDMELLTNLLDSLGTDVVNTWMATKQLKLDSNVKVLADNLKRPANSHVAGIVLDELLNHEPLINGLDSEQRLKLISKLTLKCEES